MEVCIRESRLRNVGLPPGEIEAGKNFSGPAVTRLRVLGYGPDGCFELDTTKIDEALARIGEKAVTWIQIIGIRQVSVIKEIGERLSIHPLALADVAQTWGRAKLQDYNKQLFVVGNAAVLDRPAKHINIEQVSIVMGSNYLVTFQETESALFEPVESRIQDPQRFIRKRDTGYLLYALLDMLVDHLQASIDAVDEEVIAMEDSMLNSRQSLKLEEIYRHKRSVILLSRLASPMQEVAKRIEMIDNELVPDSLDYYFRDLHEHAVRAGDRVDHARSLLQNLQEYYHIEGDHRNNDVMRMLSVVATIFIPMSFVTGVYGMNFNTADGPYSMPELNNPYGYPICLAVLACYALFMYRYFKRKKWL